MVTKLLRVFYVMVMVFTILPAILFSVNMQNLPSQVTQPDGKVLNLLASGDEFYNKLHDANGFTIIQSLKDGYYYYAQKNGDELVPSAWRVGSANPASCGLTPNLNISEAAYKEKARLMRQHANRDTRTPPNGTVNNICILIRFSDQTEFEIPRSAYEYKFNALGDSVNSQRNYFNKVSYNQLDIVTGIYPAVTTENNLSYQDSHPRAYFMPYNAITNQSGYSDFDQRLDREIAMLRNAINAVASQIPPSLNIDADNDNYVDNVCFIVRGPHTAWADLLWGHYSGFYMMTVPEINGKEVGGYTFQTEDQNEVRVLCHEMFHAIGAPDLYHYDFTGVTPTGNWDIMESGYGHMGAYMKWKYGQWIPYIDTIWATGDYTLSPVSQNTAASCYRINVSGHPNDYFILEYRKKDSDYFEHYLPDSGLLIYRIYSRLYGNAEGPPDEVYLFRPNGTSTTNGQIYEAAFSQDNYRSEFNDYTNPNSFWSDNTLAHLNISNVGLCGDNITFHYSNDNSILPPQVNITSPLDGAICSIGNLRISATATAQNDSISMVQYYLDGVYIDGDTAPPYETNWPDSLLQLGYHELVVTATTFSNLTSSRHVHFRVIDPMQPNWFGWTSDNPVYDAYRRGFLPIQVAVDMDLGNLEYKIKGLAFYVTDDPYGNPTLPGRVSVKINRFANGLITDTTLVELGDFYFTMPDRFETDIDYNFILTGKIAVILNLYEYQNIVFDTNGVSGHSWITEPLRPWTDALGRGMNGAADIALKLQNPYAGNDDNNAPEFSNSLSCYPNPFNQQTSIVLTIDEKSKEVDIAVYNLKGQKVKSMSYRNLDKGSHELSWDGTDKNGTVLGSGLYLIKMTSNGKQTAIRKITLLK